MELDIRLNIFKESGMLSEENYNKVLKVIEYFNDIKNIKLVEENAAMFITHLCSALGRMDKNEIVNDIDEEILESLKLEEKYNESMHLVKDLKEVIGEIPKEEMNFLVMHVCTLLAQV
ncbi:PRD domain-containing protein [Clostridium sp. AL.422]|uniref:PRD domain-containing protein n=1 Tax=Clostridium TaxID=1485 RepID=UPI00293DB016|nr:MULTISPECIES: PRD domain-containing protein [unclassified Clostridium]MDV4150412.1 PRD domain-containing protein [Clostridium sp. AL.422]